MFDIKTLQKAVKKKGGGVIRGQETLKMFLEGLGMGFERFQGC